MNRTRSDGRAAAVGVMLMTTAGAADGLVPSNPDLAHQHLVMGFGEDSG